MKTIKVLYATFIVFVTIQSANAQSEKENIHNTTKIQTIKVYSNCGMCKNCTEKAATTVAGVQFAVLNEDINNLALKYSQFKKEAVDAVQKKIAAVKHDTEKYHTNDAVYQKIPDCCHYDRKAVKQ